MSNEESVAFLGLLQLQAAVDKVGPLLDPPGWQAVVRTLSVASCTDHLLSVCVTLGCGLGRGLGVLVGGLLVVQHCVWSMPFALLMLKIVGALFLVYIHLYTHKYTYTHIHTHPHTFLHAFSPPSPSQPHLQALEPGTPISASEARAVEDVIRCRCALVICCQRLMAEVVSDWQHTMPPEHQLALLGVLKDTVDRAMVFNTNPQRRAAVAVFLNPHGGMGGAGRAHGAGGTPPPGVGVGRERSVSSRGGLTGVCVVVVVVVVVVVDDVHVVHMHALHPSYSQNPPCVYNTTHMYTHTLSLSHSHTHIQHTLIHTQNTQVPMISQHMMQKK